MITAIVLITVFYIAPLIGCYVWIQKAHSKGGIWEYTNPDSSDIYFTLFPGINIIAVFSMWSDSPTKSSEEKRKGWINKFFGIKK